MLSMGRTPQACKWLATESITRDCFDVGLKFNLCGRTTRFDRTVPTVSRTQFGVGAAAAATAGVDAEGRGLAADEANTGSVLVSSVRTP